ncbi:MAG: hypothetical protein GX607_10230 [Myxococcales bacterium]|jgi:hypothetical protein|nr:hypothetical protein [Myxococcales bacterium]
MVRGFHSHRICRRARRRGALARFALLLGVFGVIGCGDPDDEPPSCGVSEPAFTIHVSAAEPQLPEDLAVTAVYGAGTETYRLGSSEGRSEVLFCSRSAPADAALPTDWESLRCELWADSSVTLRVTSSSYPPLEEELQPRFDRCGVVTRTIELTLEVVPFEEGTP